MNLPFSLPTFTVFVLPDNVMDAMVHDYKEFGSNSSPSSDKQHTMKEGVARTSDSAW